MKFKGKKDDATYVKQQIYVSQVDIKDRFIGCTKDIFNKYDIGKDSYILDIGCRRGDGIRQLLKDGYLHAYGTDIGKAMIKSDDWDSHFVQQDMHDPIQFAHSFDFISIIHTLEHSHDYKKVLQIADKKLKDNGLLYIVVPKGELDNAAHYFAAEKLEDLIPAIEELGYTILEKSITRNNSEFNYLARKEDDD